MYQFNLFIGGCVLLMSWITVQGDGCANRETYGIQEINMCEQKSWTLGRVVISVTSESMGNNTGCVCVIRSRTPLRDSSTSFQLRGADSNVSRCGESQIQINPFSNFIASHIQNFTCTSPLESTSFTGRTADDVTITLTRPDTSVGVSYCLLVQPDRWLEGSTVIKNNVFTSLNLSALCATSIVNAASQTSKVSGMVLLVWVSSLAHTADDMELSCQSGLTPPSPPTTTSSSTAVTSTISLYTTTTTTRLTTTTTTSTSTNPSPTPALPTSSTQSTMTRTASSTSSSAPSSSSTLPTSSLHSAMTSTALSKSTSVPDGNSVITGSFSTTQTDSLASDRQDFPIGAVAGIVLGAITIICLTVIVVVYIRHKRRPASKLETGADNSAYTSLSDVTRVTPRADPNYAVIQSERSSSQPGGNDATTPASVYETVDADGSVTRDSNYVNSSNVGNGTYYNV